MSTQKTIDEHHIAMAEDGLGSAMSYLGAVDFGPQVEAARLAIRQAMKAVREIDYPVMAVAWRDEDAPR